MSEWILGIADFGFSQCFEIDVAIVLQVFFVSCIVHSDRHRWYCRYLSQLSFGIVEFIVGCLLVVVEEVVGWVGHDVLLFVVGFFSIELV